MTKTRDELKEIVYDAAKEVMRLGTREVDFDANLRDTFGMDSIDMFDILAVISQKLDRSFYPEEFKEITTLNDFLARLEVLVNENSQ